MRIQLTPGVGLSKGQRELRKPCRRSHGWGARLGLSLKLKDRNSPPLLLSQPHYQHQATWFDVQWELHTKIQSPHHSQKGTWYSESNNPCSDGALAAQMEVSVNWKTVLHGGKPCQEQSSNAAHVLNKTHENSRTRGPAEGKLWRFCYCYYFNVNIIFILLIKKYSMKLSKCSKSSHVGMIFEGYCRPTGNIFISVSSSNEMIYSKFQNP